MVLTATVFTIITTSILIGLYKIRAQILYDYNVRIKECIKPTQCTINTSHRFGKSDESRKARDVFIDGTTGDERKEVAKGFAEEIIDEKLRELLYLNGAVATGTVGGIGLGADIAQEDNNNLIFNPITGAAALGGLGAVSGHHVATKNLNKPATADAVLARGNRGRLGAVVGGGAGLLLSLIQSLEDKDPAIYI